MAIYYLITPPRIKIWGVRLRYKPLALWACYSLSNDKDKVMEKDNTLKLSVSDRIKHFFNVVSKVRPIVWISLYVALTPVFALIYYWLPDSQFRIPDGAGTDYGSWLYYSIVTITTLGFGDYTPAHGWAQAVTAVEVMCGLVILGFFLNAVGSMKSEIDVASEVEKQRRMHELNEKTKLQQAIPAILHTLNKFLAYCYAMTTPLDRRDDSGNSYNPDFRMSDMQDMFKPSGLPFESTKQPCVVSFLKCASQTSLYLDSLQNRLDMTLWPELLEDSFKFVANYQMYAQADNYVATMTGVSSASTGDDLARSEAEVAKRIAAAGDGSDLVKDPKMKPIINIYNLIKEEGDLARRLETVLTSYVS